MTDIFTTIHGSRLYGLAHDKSDYDFYTVVTNDHKFEEGERGQRVRSFGDVTEDHVVITLGDFLKRVSTGSHQAVEALFSPVKQYTEPGFDWAFLFGNMRVTSPDVFAAYERTIRKFAFQDFKRRRHGVRLAMNLEALRKHGRFSPVMNGYEIHYANRLAETMSGNNLLRQLDIPLSDGYAESQTKKEEES